MVRSHWLTHVFYRTKHFKPGCEQQSILYVLVYQCVFIYISRSHCFSPKKLLPIGQVSYNVHEQAKSRFFELVNLHPLGVIRVLREGFGSGIKRPKAILVGPCRPKATQVDPRRPRSTQAYPDRPKATIVGQSRSQRRFEMFMKLHTTFMNNLAIIHSILNDSLSRKLVVMNRSIRVSLRNVNMFWLKEQHC